MKGIRGCSQKHFQNVLSFSKHRIWCPSPLGWNKVNCLVKQNRLGLKHSEQFLISFWFLLLASMARKGMQPKAFLKFAFIFKASIWWSGILYVIPCKCHITFITLRFFYVKTSLEKDRTLNLNSFFDIINGQAWKV